MLVGLYLLVYRGGGWGNKRLAIFKKTNFTFIKSQWKTVLKEYKEDTSSLVFAEKHDADCR